MPRRGSTPGRHPVGRRTGAATVGVAGDSVDRIVAEWATERPDLAMGPIEVVTRLTRVLTRLDEDMGDLFARHDLSAADFTMLAALRRAGDPYTLAQSVLSERLRLTSGTVSVRLTRLEARGIVRRSPSTRDARGVHVTLTPQGVALFDRVAPEHLANEDVLLSALAPAERTQLADLLRVLLVGFEHDRATSPLGFAVEPAHRARRARAAVGLSDRIGLLVVDVAPYGPARDAGLRVGDLLLEVDGRRTVSLLALTDGAADPDRASSTLRVVRGEDEQILQIATQRAQAAGRGI